jgi:hypothetical protein
MRNRVALELLKYSVKIHRCCWFGGVVAATPPNQPQRCISTDYFNNYNFSKLKQYAP